MDTRSCHSVQTFTSETFTSRVLECQKSGKGYKALVSSLSLYCYQYAKKFYNLGEDESSDFFLFFYPKMLRMLKDFHFIGKPFENYIASVLKWQLKVYTKKRRGQEKRWNLAIRRDMWDFPDTDSGGLSIETFDPLVYKALGLQNGRIADPVLQRRFLIFCLRSANFLEDGDITKIAHMTGFSEQWIHCSVHSLRESLAAKKEKLNSLTQRRNRAYYRVQQIEEECKEEILSNRKEILKRKLVVLKRTMNNAMKEISRLKLTPSNRAIAETIGVPKGTVDSAFYWLNRRFSGLNGKEIPRYA